MKGTALIYRPGKTEPEVVTLSARPSLEFLQGVVGGFIEVVPLFEKIPHDGQLRECVVFCNEEGKLEQQPVNTTATRLWHAALPAPGLRREDGGVADILVGPIVVLFGDDEFMEDL